MERMLNIDRDRYQESISARISVYALAVDYIVKNPKVQQRLSNPDKKLKYLRFQIDELAIKVLERECIYEC